MNTAEGFKCRHCSKFFTVKCNWQRHENIGCKALKPPVIGKYKCGICGWPTDDNKAVYRHSWKEHNRKLQVQASSIVFFIDGYLISFRVLGRGFIEGKPIRNVADRSTHRKLHVQASLTVFLIDGRFVSY